MSFVFALMVGAMAAMALPPQMPVPAEMRLESFQSILNAFPKRYPPPNAAARVNIMVKSEYLPTCRTWVNESVAPMRMMAIFRMLFDVNLMPGSRLFFVLVMGLSAIPIRSAKTPGLMSCLGMNLAIWIAMSEMRIAKRIPLRFFLIVCMGSAPFCFYFECSCLDYMWVLV